MDRERAPAPLSHLLPSLGFLLLGPPLAAGSCAVEPPSATGGSSEVVRIGTFNVQNLFDGDLNGPTPALEATTTPAPEELADKLAALGSILDQLSADVVLLQEVENRAVLEALVAAGGLGDRYPERVLVEGNDPRGIDLALLSRIRVEQYRTHRDDVFSRPDGSPTSFARDCLEVHLRAAGRRLVLLGVHLRSRRDDDPQQRLAEARQVRKIAEAVRAERPDAGVVILGDANAPPDAPAARALAGDAGDCTCDGPMYASAGSWLAPRDRWTVVGPAGRELVDDLWLCPRAASWATRASVRVLHDSALAADLWTASDHAPLSVDLNLTPD